MSGNTRATTVGIGVCCFVWFFLCPLSASAQVGTEGQQGPPAAGDEKPDEIGPAPSIEVALPEITPGPEITLAEALAAADKRNMTLAAIRIEVEKADAQLGLAWALVFPAAQANLQYMRSDHEDSFNMGDSLQPLLDAMGIALPPGSGGEMVIRRQDILNGTVQAGLPLINLQSWLTISVAKRGADLAELGVESARQQLLLGVAQAYFATMMARSLIDLRQEALRSATHHMKVARERYNAGDGVRIDLVRAETDLEQARKELLTAALALDNARDALGLLTGLGGLPMPVDDQVTSVPEDDEGALISTALRDRKDIALKRKTVGLMERQLDASWMQFVPTLDAGWQFQYQFTKPADLGSDDRSRWAAILTLSVPIYNQFRYADLDQKRASLRQAMFQADDANLSLAVEVRKAKRNYLTALSSVEIAERQAVLVHEALSLVEASYAAGMGSSLEVTDARRNVSAVEVNLAAQRLKSQIALLALLRSVGEDMTDVAGRRKEN